MPVLDTSLYDSADYVLDLARAITNDCQLSIEGNLLADSQPWTFPLLTAAWLEICDRLGNNNVESFPAEVQLLNLVQVAQQVNTDPAVQTYVSATGYFDGVNTWPNPVLPADIEIPLKLWERPTGQTSLNYVMMAPANAGLPTWQRTSMLRVWEWRDDQLYFCGAMQNNDVRLRYRRRLQDIPADGTAPVPIIAIARPLAYCVAQSFTEARGGEVSETFSERKESAIKDAINRTTRKKQYQNFRRQPYSRRGTRLNWGS